MRGQNIFFFLFHWSGGHELPDQGRCCKNSPTEKQLIPRNKLTLWTQRLGYNFSILPSPSIGRQDIFKNSCLLDMIWGTLLHPLDNLKKALIKHFSFSFSFFCFVNCRCRISTWWYAKEYFSDERAGSSLSGFVSSIGFGPDDLNTCVLSFPHFLNFLGIKVLCFQCFREA